MGDFQLRINDIRHEIQLPDDQIARLLLVNEDNEVLFQDIFHVNFFIFLDGCNQTTRTLASLVPGDRRISISASSKTCRQTNRMV